jgi:hypothetical protein
VGNQFGKGGEIWKISKKKKVNKTWKTGKNETNKFMEKTTMLLFFLDDYCV